MTGIQFNLLTMAFLLLADSAFLISFRSARQLQSLIVLALLLNAVLAWWLPTFVMNAALLVAMLIVEAKEMLQDE